MRGRGYQVFDEPVFPEPPFAPFIPKSMNDLPVVDNGSRPSFLGSLFRKAMLPPTPPAVIEGPEEEPQPPSLIREPAKEFQIVLPAETNFDKHSFQQFFSSITLCDEPIAFELIGVHKKVHIQIAAAANDAPLLEQQLRSHFPEVELKPTQDGLAQMWITCSGEAIVAEFGLAREFMFSLVDTKLDPFVGIIGALSSLQPDEIGVLQVLWQPLGERWRECVLDSVTDTEGKPIFVNVPELTDAAQRKVSKPLYAAVIRVATKAETFKRALKIACDMASALRVFANPEGNHLIPLANDEYPYADHVTDMLFRQSRRNGMILNSEELAGFVHLPSNEVQSPVLLRDAGMTRQAPQIVRESSGIVIGDNEHLDETIPVFLTPDQRVRHTHVIGISGTGKSSLLFNMIRQDIENGDGVAVLDPHGDLIDQLLGIIPDDRIDDVVLLDPVDVEFPVAFNILHAHSEEEKNLLASDLISIFRRFSTSWGDQMDIVFHNAILAFLESSRGGSLKDLQLFLLDKPPFRDRFLETVKDSEVVNFWRNVFPQLTGVKSVPSVLARLQDFFSRKPLRNMVSQPKSKLDFADIMDNGKIFLAKLSEGLCGEENSYLLGTLLVSKFQQLAMARQSQRAADREDFWLYIDEFDQFITPSMAKILKGARKYRLGLTLAHQELHQLQKDPNVASAVMAHPCTRIVFRVEDDDARKLSDGFESFEARHLQTLEKFHAIARVERNDFDFSLISRKPELPVEAEAVNKREKVIAASRAKYATPRAEVEAALAVNIEKPKPPSSAPPMQPAQRIEPKLPPTQSARVIQRLANEREMEPEKEPVAPKELAAAMETEEQSHHTAIKERIRVQAESLDYTVSLEEFIAGTKRIDVVLRRGKRAIACEVNENTQKEYEVYNNLTKCLNGNFWHVAMISRNRKKLERVKKLFLETASSEEIAKVGFYSPEEFISKLYDWATDDPQGGLTEKGKPKKRKISFDAANLTGAELKQREDDMLKALVEAMKRK